MKRSFNPKQRGIAQGYRSGLEELVAKQLEEAGVRAEYEATQIPYTDPVVHKYKPDFVLPNGIIIETKGRFVTKDRMKHRLIKTQHPHLDIRFVFSRSTSRIAKGSNTTHADWCKKYGFLYADKLIPSAWLKEKQK